MFYIAEVEDHIRVEPKHFGLATKDAVTEQLQESYIRTMHKELGFVISVISVEDVGEGVIIPGDGAAYYKSKFTVLVWKPELHELIPGTIKDITNFGAFMQIGPTQGMIHISQTMEDFVSLSKTGNLQGKISKRSLNVGDNCLARIVAISYKAGEPKIGLTMRQPGLGKIEWIEDAQRKAIASAKKIDKGESKKPKKEKKNNGQ
ncbi:DNA-directed RNA polymerase [Candidatus Pacearchaeota archaeon]|nr:DNA-directed RNA polymerase [Candidatus Pacearchaeota archaeon]